MDLNKLAEEAYATACEHGWHDEEHCDEHYLMLIITEIAEAVQADRNGKHADVAKFKEWQKKDFSLLEETRERRFKEDFEEYIKNSVESELADIVIRCLDLMGLRGITLECNCEPEEYERIPFAEDMFWTCAVLAHDEYSLQERLRSVILSVMAYALGNGIDIEWFIRKKMEYNRLRPYKNGGKKY